MLDFPTKVGSLINPIAVFLGKYGRSKEIICNRCCIFGSDGLSFFSTFVVEKSNKCDVPSSSSLELGVGFIEASAR